MSQGQREEEREREEKKAVFNKVKNLIWQNTNRKSDEERQREDATNEIEIQAAP
jgi:hypothetical protein